MRLFFCEERKMIDMYKVAFQIKDDSLYNTILFEMKEELNKEPSYSEIESLLTSNKKYIQDYKDINRYSELSSIQAQELVIYENDEEVCKESKQSINTNVGKLKALENFSVDSTHSAYEIWIGSAGVMVVFMMHNIIALFSELYYTHTFMVYSSFVVVLALTFVCYKKIKTNHEKQHVLYNELYEKTEKMITFACMNNYISERELYGR